jgi:glycosyltransferase involved in cell wall biosynthesis
LLGEFSPKSFGQEIMASSPNVRYVGLLPFEDVPRHLAESHIGIVCLRPEPAHLESLPVKLFEYMQARLPVVASNFPLWREIVNGAGCGLLVDPTKPEEIAATIRRLADDPMLRRKMGEAGARAVEEKYTWEAEAKGLLAAYEMLDRLRCMQTRTSNAWPKEV